MFKQNRAEFNQKLDYLKKQISNKDVSNSPARHFTSKYAIIYAIEKFDQLKKIDKHLVDSKRLENDYKNQLAAVRLSKED